MSQETDRLAREADERRSSLDETLDSLKGRFSPGQIVDELSAYVREGQGADMVKNLNRQVRDNPLALGLVGAGLAWLLLGQGVRDGGQRLKSQVDDWRGDDRDDWQPDRWADDDRDNAFSGPERSVRYTSDYQDDLAHDVPRSVARGSYASGSTSRGSGMGSSAKSALSGAASSVGSTASSVGSGIESAASSAAGAVSSAAHAVGDAVSGAASSAAHGASRLSHDARDAAYDAGNASYRGASYAGQRVKRTFLDTLQEEPLILGAIAVAVGAAIGAALPSTQTEDEWLGDTRDKLRDDAMSYGRDALNKAEHVAEKAYEAGSAEADAKGLKPSGSGDETLAEKVSSVAQTALNTAKDEAKKEGLT